MNDKFVSPEKPPEGLERELLTILIEECAEVQQRATKMLRFGVNEAQPGQPYTNAERLSVEVGDLSHLVRRCIDARLLDGVLVLRASEAKREKLDRFLQSDTEANHA